jgi:cystathionine beta-lyase/cystathionine gamma-synthase
LEARQVAGIADRLLRLSIGLEHEGDLIADLTQGLDAA